MAAQATLPKQQLSCSSAALCKPHKTGWTLQSSLWPARSKITLALCSDFSLTDECPVFEVLSVLVSCYVQSHSGAVKPCAEYIAFTTEEGSRTFPSHPV